MVHHELHRALIDALLARFIRAFGDIHQLLPSNHLSISWSAITIH
jgi:hypothetical protein